MADSHARERVPVLDVIPTGAMVCTPSLVVAAINDACQGVTGRPGERLVGTRLTRLFPPGDRPRLGDDSPDGRVVDGHVDGIHAVRLRAATVPARAVVALSDGRLADGGDDPWWFVTVTPQGEASGAELDPDATFDALADADCRRLLATADRHRTASELSRACEVPRSTTYRKLDRLRTAGLVSCRLAVADEGRHPTTYARRVDRLAVDLGAPVGVELADTDGDGSTGDERPIDDE